LLVSSLLGILLDNKSLLEDGYRNTVDGGGSSSKLVNFLLQEDLVHLRDGLLVVWVGELLGEDIKAGVNLLRLTLNLL
jgi:hypothetical protein